jgi:hypothetical protein
VRKCLVALVLMAAFVPVTAVAKCGTGNPPSYDDIEAVMLTQGGGMLRVEDPRFRSTTLDDSKFWVFWFGSPTEYSQYDLPGKIGTFHLATTISDARAVLRRDHFFSLSPRDNVEVTDTRITVLSVKRCGVITKMRQYGVPEADDAPTQVLFEDLRRLVKRSKAWMVSRKPTDFRYVLLFNPEEQF